MQEVAVNVVTHGFDGEPGPDDRIDLVGSITDDALACRGDRPGQGISTGRVLGAEAPTSPKSTATGS